MEEANNQKVIHHGHWIQSLIDEQNLTLSEVGEGIGRDASTIQRWTKKESLDPRKLKIIADYFQIDLREHFQNMDYVYNTRKNYQAKYYELLEKYSDLQDRYQSLLGKSSK